MFVFEEKEKTGVSGEKPLEGALRTNTKLKPHMALTHTTSVGGECSHDHATLTPFPSPRKFEVVIVLYCFDCERSWKEKKKRLKRGRGHWSQMCLIRNLPSAARYKPQEIKIHQHFSVYLQ